MNLASRLEGQTKAYRVDIIIGEETAKQAPDYAVLELDVIAVKGKTEGVRIFTLLGREDKAMSAEFKRHGEKHAAMLEAYYAQRWDDSGALMAECRELDTSKMDRYYDMLPSASPSSAPTRRVRTGTASTAPPPSSGPRAAAA